MNQNIGKSIVGQVILFDGIEHEFLHDVRRSVLEVAGESAQRLPCRLTENRVQRTGRAAAAGRREAIHSAEQRPIGQCSRQIGATAHQSHQVAAHLSLLITSHQ